MGSLRPAMRWFRRGRFRVGIGLVVLALTLALGPPTASAATITVNTTADELNADGDCSLREAILAANTNTAVDACAAGSGATDLINVPAGTFTLSIPGAGEDANATGDLDFSSGAALVGAGAAATVIDGAGLDRVLHVLATPGIFVAVQDLTIRGGGGECHGGGIHVEHLAVLVVRDSTLTDNAAGNGGAISNAGRTEIYDSVLSDNVGGHRGGAIWNGDHLSIENSSITGNTFNFSGGCPGSAFFGGGGIFNEGPQLSIEESTLEGNTSSFNAGAINNWFGADLGLARITLSGNSADDRGGGLFNLGTARVENVTVSGNSAIQTGGGIWTGSGTLSLASSTLSGNGSMHGVGGLQNTFGTADVGSTILANSAGGDCSGPINSLGYNLIEDAAGCAIAGDPSGNIIGVDPVLGPLADNGGVSRTHALLPGSPAIDAGNPACPPPHVDQRIAPRPQGSRCDIGAFELETVVRVPQHFLRYRLEQSELTTVITAELFDQFGTMTVELQEGEWLLNPAEKRRQGRDPEPIQREDEHLVCYGLPYMSASDRTVTVENQFGRSTLRVGRPLTFCTAASKTFEGNPGPPPDGVGHFLCYDVRGETPLFPSETLVARDQFGERTIRIDRTRELCNPAGKRVGERFEPIIRPEEHLVCYRITTQTPSLAPLRVITTDQFFGQQTLRVRALERLCTPSTKEHPEGA
jgi:CSLREA domain-containing protein